MEQLNLKLTLNEEGSITAAWSPITNAVRYHIFRYINGQRRSRFHTLTEKEIAGLKEDIRAINADENLFKFNKGGQTGFLDSNGKIYVRGDVLPDLDSTYPRDLMSSRAVLAHEYYGHKFAFDKYGHLDSFPTQQSWNDEFRASYKTNPLNQGGVAPKITDITTPGNTFELPAPWIEWLEEYGGNARIVNP